MLLIANMYLELDAYMLVNIWFLMMTVFVANRLILRERHCSHVPDLLATKYSHAIAICNSKSSLVGGRASVAFLHLKNNKCLAWTIEGASWALYCVQKTFRCYQLVRLTSNMLFFTKSGEGRCCIASCERMKTQQVVFDIGVQTFGHGVNWFVLWLLVCACLAASKLLLRFMRTKYYYIIIVYMHYPKIPQNIILGIFS